jgi:hypothetical protein
LDLLDGGQLAAVLSHERAHARARHDLVLLPFAALCRALPGVRWARAAEDAVALLVEMAADDRARRSHADRVLAAALVRFAAAPVRMTPPGALAATGQLTARVTRLLAPRTRPPRLGPTLTLAVAQVLVVVPPLLFLR